MRLKNPQSNATFPSWEWDFDCDRKRISERLNEVLLITLNVPKKKMLRVLRYNNWHKRFIFEDLEKHSN
jgi:hypothetical protein